MTLRRLRRRRPASGPTLMMSLLLCLVVLCALTLTASAGFPRTVVDGIGRSILLDERPARIFSATLATDNILLTLVEPERVVGVTRFASDSRGSYVADKVRPHMTQIDALSPELILSAAPDLVLLASWNDPDAVKQLRDLGLSVYTFTSFSSVADALENIRRVGEITGEEERAEALIDSFNQEAKAIALAIGDRPRPKVLSWDSWGTTTGTGTSMHDIIEMAGGENLAATHSIEGWKEIDRETIISMNPDVIVTESGQSFVESVLADPTLQSVTAVRTGRVVYVEHTGALNHHFILAIRQLAQYLHPEAF